MTDLSPSLLYAHDKWRERALAAEAERDLLRCLATSPRFQTMTVAEALRELNLNLGYRKAV